MVLLKPAEAPPNQRAMTRRVSPTLQQDFHPHVILSEAKNLRASIGVPLPRFLALPAKGIGMTHAELTADGF